MFHYLQYRPDKQERWKFVSVKQMETLNKKPAYLSVLAVNQDVEALEEAGEDPLDVVKYKGPMYFDLDGANNIDAVLQASRDLLDKILKQLGVPAEYVQCWLSGGKGVHFTINERVFGVKGATKHLPYIYHELAKQVEVPFLDMGVYSAGKGRLWRCPGVARPGTGTYKVAVSLEELETMDAETYELLCREPRQERELPNPPDNLAIARAEVAFKRAKQAAGNRVRAIKNAKVVPTEELRQLDHIPGCIEKLITKGDCEESNYNQAAMQLAAWIAARYTREEEELYNKEVLEPFIANVQSSTRPEERERRKHLKDQINRGFSGKTKFSVGPLISSIGEPCYNCPLCRGDLEFGEPELVEPSEGAQTYQFFDKASKVIAKADGYYQHRGESNPRKMADFTFWPHTILTDVEETSPGVYEDKGDTALVGELIVAGHVHAHNYKIETEAWSSVSTMRRAMNAARTGMVSAESDLQGIYQAIISQCVRDISNSGGVKDGITLMAEVNYCGILLEKQKLTGGRVRYIPHYVEEHAAITPTRTGSVASKYRFRPPTRDQGELSPRLLDEEFPFEDDTELLDALRGLFSMNEPAAMAKAIGWLVACSLKEHLHQIYGQFPLLNMWGNASAGKSMTVYTLCRLAGIDYMETTQAVNMETATPKPLRVFVSSSSTVPRMIEELNESGVRAKGNYIDAMGVLKAAYNQASIQRGEQRGMNVTRVKSPIVYISEQRPIAPAVRNRSIEVMLTAANREKPGRSVAFTAAFTGRHHMHRAAKAILDTALRMTVDDARELFELDQERIADTMDARPRYNFRTCLMGLNLLKKSLARFDVDVSAEVEELKQALVNDLGENYHKIEQSLRRSEVDMVMMDFDQMAVAPDAPDGIAPERDYLKAGNWLKIELSTCFSRYRRFNRNNGGRMVFQRVDELGELLVGEVYFDRLETDPDRPKISRFVLNVEKMEEKGISTAHFRESQL